MVRLSHCLRCLALASQSGSHVKLVACSACTATTLLKQDWFLRVRGVTRRERSECCEMQSWRRRTRRWRTMMRKAAMILRSQSGSNRACQIAV